MIVGAGLAGLITAHVFPRMPIIERSPEPAEIHKAVLRFRTDAIGELTGIPFKPVTVRKGIWHANKFVPPSIDLANMYAKKCVGHLAGDRSIWSLDPVTRFIAPEDFYQRLVECVNGRVLWGTKADFDCDQPMINTAPLPVVLKELGIETRLKFEPSPIVVKRGRVSGASVYQTVYFPSEHTALYRASITGDLLICELAGEPDALDPWNLLVDRAFGGIDVTPLESSSQRYGKIAPLPKEISRALIAMLTTDHKIYSVGRFATWRNVLLDDVLHDALVVKRLMNVSHYERQLILTKGL